MGNDMADHLGDGRYVLVPHDARYPSMGAAVMGVEACQRPLASWSADRQIVADWLEQRGGSGVVLAGRKPRRR
ncbi:hypothetical protein [Streptomyces sp. NPDC058674]|uniref:hypothetical protein n=1 Tax=Streptomyces sp. NPDC058674 TaxID=3346592 RepID=UPI0036677572